MKIHADAGDIIIPDDVFTSLAGEAATSCFGVKGMVACTKDGGYWQLLRRESMSKGVKLKYNEEDNTIGLELHIGIDRGVNINAVATSIMNEVMYKLQISTGVKVDRIDIFIDAIIE